MQELPPGTVLNASSLNARTTEVTAALNAASPRSVRERALRGDHLPEQVLDQRFLSFIHANGYYDSTYPGFNTAAGWATVDSQGVAGGGTDLELTFGASVDLTDPAIAGILLRADFDVQYAKEKTVATLRSVNVHACLQAYNGAAWQQIPETEVWQNVEGGASFSAMFRDLPIRFLLQQGNFNGITDVEKIRARICASYGFASANGPEFYVGYAGLGATVLRGEQV